MIPISLYKTPVDLERYATQIRVLVVSTYDSDRRNYQTFISSQFPNSKVDVCDYDRLRQQLYRASYDALILDNDAFFIDKNPALDNLVAVGEFIDKAKVIVTAAIHKQDLVDRVNQARARFIEKGRWKTLQESLREIKEKYNKNRYTSVA